MNPPSGLKEFRKVLGDFRELGSLAVKGTIVAPVVGILAKLGPPPTLAISTLTSVAAFVAVVWTFHFCFATTGKKLNVLLRWCLGVFCFALLASGLLLELFTLRPPHKDPVVLGFTLRPDVTPLISDSFTDLDALRGAEYDPEAVWTRASIAVVHAAVITSWVVTFVALSMFFSIFIIVHRRPAKPLPT